MLKPLLIALLFLMPLSQAAPPQSAGSPRVYTSEIWNAWNATPRDQLPKAEWPIALHTDVPTTFLIYTNGGTFGGKAIVDDCPGYGDLIDGKIEGDHVSFTVIAHNPLMGQDETIYYSGTRNGDQMDLVMRWPLGHGQTLQWAMKAKKFRHD